MAAAKQGDTLSLIDSDVGQLAANKERQRQVRQLFTIIQSPLQPPSVKRSIFDRHANSEEKSEIHDVSFEGHANNMQLINKDFRTKLSRIYLDAKLTESQSQNRLKRQKLKKGML